MSRRVKGTERLFSRQDIYAIRRFWDAKWEEGWSYARIAEALAPQYFPASNQTIIRIGKRETWREIGVGAGERANLSNRLQGESRRTGEPVQMPPEYQMDGELSEYELAMAKERIVVPPIRLLPDGQVHHITPGEQGLEMLMGRCGPVRGSFDDPAADEPETGESSEAIIARKAKEEGK